MFGESNQNRSVPKQERQKGFAENVYDGIRKKNGGGKWDQQKKSGSGGIKVQSIF